MLSKNVLKPRTQPRGPDLGQLLKVLIIKQKNKLKAFECVYLLLLASMQVGVAAWLECWLSHLGVAGLSPGRDNL